MFNFNKPLLLNLSKEVTTESVKEQEKIYRIDIGGTWLYKFTMDGVEDTKSPVTILSRVRYNPEKESVDKFVTKMPFMTQTDNGYQINVDEILNQTANVHIKVKDCLVGEKSYIVHIDIADMEVGTAELYIVFCSYSADSECQKVAKKLVKKVKKILK